MSEGIMLTKENGGVALYSRLSCINSLAFEVYSAEKGSGMTMTRGSALQGCQRHGLLPMGKRTTKKAGLRNAVKKMQELYPDWTPNDRVVMALELC